MTLTEFLLARIAEDEHWANALATEWGNPYTQSEDRFDTARVLAECEAKRRIIAEHRDDGHGGCFGCGFGSDEERMNTVDECPTLRALGSVYANHPDFDSSWSVDSGEQP